MSSSEKVPPCPENGQARTVCPTCRGAGVVPRLEHAVPTDCPTCGGSGVVLGGGGYESACLRARAALAAASLDELYEELVRRRLLTSGEALEEKRRRFRG